MHRKMAEHRRAIRLPKMQLEHRKYTTQSCTLLLNIKRKNITPWAKEKMGVITIISTANDPDNGCSNLTSIQAEVNTWAFPGSRFKKILSNYKLNTLHATKK